MPNSDVSPSENDTRICPMCAEMIKKAAVICRYCGAEFDGAGTAVKRPTQQTVVVAPPIPTSSLAVTALIGAILWLGGLGSLVGVVWGFYAKKDIDAGRGSGRGIAVAAIVLGFIGLIVTPMFYALLSS